MPEEKEKIEELKGKIVPEIENIINEKVIFKSSSTDCNIPLSMGIPAVCVGCVRGGGAHTREDFVEIDSLAPGLGVAFEMILSHFAD